MSAKDHEMYNSSDEDDDECLFELDVYVNGNNKAEEDLFVFQYPLRKKDRPYGDAGNQLLKIERSVPPKNESINENFKGMEDITDFCKSEPISNFRLTYQLNKGSTKPGGISNYDENAVDHRIDEI